MNLGNLFSTNITTTQNQPVTVHSLVSGLFGKTSAAGTEVTLATAEAHTTVMSCYRVLAESVASMPIHLMKREIEDGKVYEIKAYEHKLYNILSRRPNDEMSQYSWIESQMMNIVSRGNAFTQIIRNNKNEVIALYPLLSDNMTIVRSDSGKLGYKYNSSNYGDVWLEKEEIVHVVGLSYDGINGLSPIQYSANSIGLSLAMEEFASNFFANGANPGAVYEIDTQLSDEAYERLRMSLKEKYEGLKQSGKPMLLEEGLKFKPITISNNDSQFLESRKFQKSEIASIFRVPPHLINDLERATFTNIEQQSLEFATYTLTPWVKRFEQALNSALFRDDQTYHVHFNMDGLVRGDIKTRYEAHGKAIRDGWLTRNEVRKREGYNPLDGLDDPIIPLNMTTDLKEENAKN